MTMAKLMVALLVTAISVGGGIWNSSEAQETAVAGTYRMGKITSVRGNTVTIDNTMYELSPDIEIHDSSGKPLEVSSIMVKAAAKFQVKREQSNRIVKMVLTLPE